MGVAAGTSVVGEGVGPKPVTDSAFPELDFSGKHGLASEDMVVEMGLVTTYRDDGEITGDVGSELGECPVLKASTGASGNNECK